MEPLYVVLGFLASSSISTFLLGWLHVRINQIHEDSVKTNKALTESIDTKSKEHAEAQEELYEHINAQINNIHARFVTKDDLNSRLQTIQVGIEAVHNRLSDFVSIVKSQDERMDKTREKVARLEAFQERK